jgi:hypothetical protein
LDERHQRESGDNDELVEYMRNAIKQFKATQSY